MFFGGRDRDRETGAAAHPDEPVQQHILINNLLI